MQLKNHVKEQILKAINEIGINGATIFAIAKRVDFERHTLSKYLSLMQANGFIYHKMYGKAKVWFINNAPLQTVLNTLPQEKTFTERVLSDLISALPNGLMVIDKDFRIIFMNNNSSRIYGKIEGQFFYKAVMDNENPLNLKEVIDITWRKKDSANMVIRDKNGKLLSISASKLANPDNSLSVILITEDVTAQKMAEETIQSQKAMLEAERETLNKCAIVSETDLKGNITYANDKFCEISKYKKEELLGKNHRIINSGYHPKSFFREMWKTIASGKVWHGTIRNKAKDGSYYWVDSAIAPVLGKSGKPVKYVSVRFDITKLKEAEKKIKTRK